MKSDAGGKEEVESPGMEESGDVAFEDVEGSRGGSVQSDGAVGRVWSSEMAEEMHCPMEEKKVRFAESDNEEPHGVAGKLLQRIGPRGYPILLVFPVAYVAIFLAVVPLGKPNITVIREQAVFLFVTNPLSMAAISYMYASAYMGLRGTMRPFHQSLGAPIAVYVMEVIVTLPIYLTQGVFELALFVSYFVAVSTTYIWLILVHREPRKEVLGLFLRFQVPIMIFIVVVASYAVLYRDAGSDGQAGLVILMAFVTFIFRRVSLTLYDPFPLEISTLIAAFWFQNLSDVFQTLAFPQVNSPKIFAAIWVANSFGNFAMLGFITKKWIFVFRPWLKSHVLNWFKCDFSKPDPPQFDYSYDFNDRGHGPNVGGYRRRQFRFFFWRLISQASAMILYLSISPMLRYGINDEYYPFFGIHESEYRNSVVYAASYLVFVLVVGVIGYRYLSVRFPETFEDMKAIHGHEFLHHTFVGFIIAILTHNLILAIAILTSHYCTFSAFRVGDCLYTAPSLRWSL